VVYLKSAHEEELAMQQRKLPQDNPQLETFLVQLDERGRLVLPLAVRNKLSLHPREKLIASIAGNTLTLSTVKTQVAKVQGILAKISPERCLSEELIQERRREAELE
jgi:bifunctional DNA-binding transcriptional regulator/antitoxin component of YhaV-PrlF toxin-antitoxin module